MSWVEYQGEYSLSESFALVCALAQKDLVTTESLKYLNDEYYYNYKEHLMTSGLSLKGRFLKRIKDYIYVDIESGEIFMQRPIWQNSLGLWNESSVWYRNEVLDLCSINGAEITEVKREFGLLKARKEWEAKHFGLTQLFENILQSFLVISFMCASIICGIFFWLNSSSMVALSGTLIFGTLGHFCNMFSWVKRF